MYPDRVDERNPSEAPHALSDRVGRERRARLTAGATVSRLNCRWGTGELFMTLFQALIPDRIRVADRAMHGVVAPDNAPRRSRIPSEYSGSVHPVPSCPDRQHRLRRTAAIRRARDVRNRQQPDERDRQQRLPVGRQSRVRNIRGALLVITGVCVEDAGTCRTRQLITGRALTHANARESQRRSRVFTYALPDGMQSSTAVPAPSLLHTVSMPP